MLLLLNASCTCTVCPVSCAIHIIINGLDFAWSSDVVFSHELHREAGNHRKDGASTSSDLNSIFYQVAMEPLYSLLRLLFYEWRKLAHGRRWNGGKALRGTQKRHVMAPESCTAYAASFSDLLQNQGTSQNTQRGLFLINEVASWLWSIAEEGEL